MIQEPTGKLGILTPGMGAVASTFMAGVIAVNKGIAEPIGSLSQMGRIRLGKRTDGRNPLIKDFAPLASLNDIVFGGWDIFEDNMSALNMVNSKIPTERSRHIDIQHFAIQDWKDAQDIVMHHIAGILNPADDLTKPLGWILHGRHCRRLMGHYR